MKNEIRDKDALLKAAREEAAVKHRSSGRGSVMM